MHRLARWVPAVVAPVVVAGAIAVPMVANAAQPLPAKSASEVLQLVAHAKSLAGFSGTVQQTSDLGLPSLPTTGAGSDSQTASTLNLLTGTHRAEVWVAGRDEARVAVLDSMGERDVVRDGDTVWTWDSAKHTATRLTLTGDAARQRSEAAQMTPAEAADALLAKIGPTTAVSVDRETSVAGRETYTLVLTPKTTETTVGAVRIAVDGETGLPLQVAVTARGASSPAFQVGFTSVSFATPAASTFDFTPPSGATVQKRTVAPRSGAASHHALAAKPTVAGTGWSQVVEVPAADVPSSIASNPTFLRLTTAVSGGRVVSTSLVNVLRTDDGRVLAGAVPVSTLVALAAQHG